MLFNKKIFCFLLIIVTIFSVFSIPVYAEENVIKMEEVFENGKINDFTSPIFTRIQTEEYDEIQVNFITPPILTDLSAKYTPAFNHLYQVENEFITGYQVDYKIDNKDWHYNKSWDTLNYNNNTDNFKYDTVVSPLTTVDATYQTTLFSTGDNSTINGDFASAINNKNGLNFIDFDNHKIEFRARAYVTYKPVGEKQTKYIFSEWSTPTVAQPMSDNAITEIPTPEINKLYIFPEEGYTNFDVEMKNNPNISIALARSKALFGPIIDFQVEGYLIPKNAEGKFDASQAIKLLPNSADTRINRPYTFTYDKEKIIEIDDWSFILKIVATQGELTSNYSEIVPVSQICLNDPRKSDDGVLLEGEIELVDRCNLCGFCPHPFGMCIFSYAFILMALIVVIIITIMVVKRRQELTN